MEKGPRLAQIEWYAGSTFGRTKLVGRDLADHPRRALIARVKVRAKGEAMADQPTTNDFLHSLRVPLGKAAERARRAFEEELNAASRTGLGGNTIRRVLDRLQQEFELSVAAALATLKHVTEATKLEASELRGLTAQELENFVRQLKATVQIERLRVRSGSPQMAVIDEELAKLDEHLRYALRQFDVGLFNVGAAAMGVAAKGMAAGEAEIADALVGLDMPPGLDGSPSGEVIDPPPEPQRPNFSGTATFDTAADQIAAMTPKVSNAAVAASGVTEPIVPPPRTHIVDMTGAALESTAKVSVNAAGSVGGWTDDHARTDCSYANNLSREFLRHRHCRKPHHDKHQWCRSAAAFRQT